MNEAANVTEIKRIQNEALNDENADAGATENATLHNETNPPEALTGETVDEVAEEFADFLDWAAGITATGLALPTVTQRFNRAANLQIATSAIKLCKKYNLDPRKYLIGEESSLGVWLGLGFAVGVPGYFCYQDWKVKRAKEVQTAEGGENGGQQPS